MNRKPCQGWVLSLCVCVCVEGMTGVFQCFIPFHVLPSLSMFVYVCVCPVHTARLVSSQRVCVPSGLWRAVCSRGDYLDYSPHLFKLQTLRNMALKCKHGAEQSQRVAVCHRTGLESDHNGMEGWWGADAVINPITSVTPGWPFVEDHSDNLLSVPLSASFCYQSFPLTVFGWIVIPFLLFLISLLLF